MPSFLALPNELILLAARELGHRDLFRLLQTNRHLAGLLTPILHDLAALNWYCVCAFFCAAATANEALIRTLLTKGDHMVIKSRARLVLHKCPGECTDEVVQAVLAEGANIIIDTRHREESGLHMACRRENNKLLKLFLKSGADPVARDGSGRTPLHIVENEAATRLLIEHGADPVVMEAGTQPWSTPLENAIHQKKLDVVKAMLEFVDVDFRRKNGKTPLHMAAQYNDEVLLRLLLDKGADVAAQDNRNDTTLHLAVPHENAQLVRLLLERGADPATTNKMHQSAVFVAGRRPFKPVYRLLLEYTNIEYRTKQRRSLLHLAIEPISLFQPPPPSRLEIEDIELIRHLLEKGININAQDAHGKTALTICTQYGCEVLVRLLLEKGADPNIRDHNQTTALHVAVQPWSQALVGMLLENGADVHAQDADARTVVHLAAMKDASVALQLFLKQGADINIRDNRGRTALHLAAIYGGNKVLKLLLDMGADIEVRDNLGWSVPESVLETCSEVISGMCFSMERLNFGYQRAV